MAHRVDTYLLDSSVYSDMTLLLDLHTACGLLTLARLHVHAISRSLHTYTRSHNVVQPRKQVHPLTVTLVHQMLVNTTLFTPFSSWVH